jgi:hypothetical protein
MPEEAREPTLDLLARLLNIGVAFAIKSTSLIGLGFLNGIVACLPGEGRDPYQPRAPAFADVTRLVVSALKSSLFIV